MDLATTDVFVFKTGTKLDDAQNCPNQAPIITTPPAARPSPDDVGRKRGRSPGGHTSRDAERAVAKEAKRLGIRAPFIDFVPWKWTVTVWLDEVLGLIVGESKDDRRAAATAVDTVARRLHLAVDDPFAASSTSDRKVARFAELLRVTTPFIGDDIMPRAATIAAWRVAVQQAKDAKAKKPGAPPALTVPATWIRRGQPTSGPGAVIPLADVIGLPLLRSLIEEGKMWFRALVFLLASDSIGDNVHYTKRAANPRESTITVWPLKMGKNVAQSWQMDIAERPVDEPYPAVLRTLRSSDAEFVVHHPPIAANYDPFFAVVGALSMAHKADSHAVRPKRGLAVMKAHVSHRAREFFKQEIAGDKSMREAYDAAVKAGAVVRGVSEDTRVTAAATTDDAKGDPTGKGKGRRQRGKGKGKSGAGAGGGAPTKTTTVVTPPVNPHPPTNPTNPPPPAPPPTPHPQTGAGRPPAGAPRKTYDICQAPNCNMKPPSGIATVPFCFSCRDKWEFDATGRPKPKG
jgi:hypothetical protein